MAKLKSKKEALIEMRKEVIEEKEKLVEEIDKAIMNEDIHAQNHATTKLKEDNKQ